MKIIALFFRTVLYAAVLLGVYCIILYDAYEGLFHESSYTEIVQETLLLLMVAAAFLSAQKYPRYRTFIRFLGVVALISLIREFNNFLEVHMFKGAWQLFVWPILLLATYYFVRHYRTLFRDVESLADTYGFGVLLSGGLLLHVFSRLYGLKTIWTQVMEDDYMYKVNRVSEESIELVAYSIIFIGFCELLLTISTYNDQRMIDDRFTASHKQVEEGRFSK